MNKTLEREFDSIFNSALRKRIDESALLYSRYLFTDRHTGISYCSHCHHSFERSGATHNQEDYCPKCKSRCTVKMTGIGRGRLTDEVYYVEYKKSSSVKGAVLAIGVIATRDYSEDYNNVQTYINKKVLYLLEVGNPRMWRYDYWTGNRYEASSVHSLAVAPSWISSHISWLYKYEAKETFFKAAKGTKLQYGEEIINVYTEPNESLIPAIAMFCKRPKIEYLYKSGLTELASDAIHDYKTYHAINWRATTPTKLLKLDMQAIRELQKYPFQQHIGCRELRAIQAIRKNSNNIYVTSMIRLISCSDNYGENIKSLRILEYTTMQKALNYIDKQIEIYPKETEKQIMSTWLDYIEECEQLEYDLSDDRVLRPKDLNKAHQNNIKMIKYKENAALDEKINKLLSEYRKLGFEFGQLFIRPAESTKEIVDEGAALSHCVGRYCSSYADKKNILLFVRMRAEPDKPYYTMELDPKTLKIRQCRGYKNKSYKDDEKVKGFIDKFEQKILRSKAS